MSTIAARSAGTLDNVRKLLEEGRPKDALDLINRSGQKTKHIQNARGVCLLRSGKHDQAMAIFRDLVFPSGSFSIDPDIPTVFQTNYVTALLMVNNVVIATSILDQIEDKKHPAVLRLRSTIRKWKRGLSLFRRLLLLVGSYPGNPVSLDFPPGDL